MPSIWCESCNDYHNEDDEYEDSDPEEEDLPPQPADPIYNPEVNNNGYRLLPQTPGKVFYAYSDELIAAFSRNIAPTNIYAASAAGCIPPNAHGYAWNSFLGSYGIWAVEDGIDGVPSNSVRTAFKRWMLEHPQFDDNWCNHRPGGRIMPHAWAGEYIITRHLRQAFVCYDPRRYDCYHCAVKAAFPNGFSPSAAEHRNVMILIVNRYQEIPEDYIPPAGEIEGEPAPTTTATIRDVVEPFDRVCANCGFMAHTSRTCELPPRAYKKIGIEIEGRFLNFNERWRNAQNDGLSGCGDGSIFTSPDSNAEPYEMKTRPGNIREVLEQLVKYYPDETDSSCGMHVHVSFDPETISCLNTPEFFAYFKRRWQEWGAKMNLAGRSQFFHRLNGGNEYCRVMHDTVNWNSQDRYSQLNFSAWRDHKTVECRLLPMFRRASLGVAAVIELMDIYETFLRNPAEYGLQMHESTATLPAVAPVLTSKKTELLELKEMLRATSTKQLELTELLPPAPGMVRVAVPVNQAITIKQLSELMKGKAA